MTDADENSGITANTVVRNDGKYLTFTLGSEEYGIAILKIKEIIGVMNITAVPQTPDYVKGVINLRGKVIPVIDLRCRFCMETVSYTERTCIVVVEVSSGTGQLMGIAVDSVSEVVHIKSDEIEDRPKFTTGLASDYISGMAKTAGRVRILLDIERVLNAEPEAILDSAA